MIHRSIVLLSLHFLICRPDMAGKIVGGLEARIENWPFIGFLMHYKDEKMYAGCGSSLISSQTLLTAAHCLVDILLQNNKTLNKNVYMSVLMGNSNIFKSTMIREVVDYVSHSDYSVEGTICDIGLVFLEKPVTFSNTVMKVLLQSFPVDYDKQKNLIFAGWGALNNTTHMPSEKLQSLSQRLLPKEECFKRIPDVEKFVICVADERDSFANRGDSGGPLMTQDGLQIGLVSYTIEDMLKTTVYTCIPDYYDWIQKSQLRLFMSNCRKGL